MNTYQAARKRTKEKIKKAFWRLYIENDFKRVTVNEIASAAGIHRSTFYAYFDTVGDVFDTIRDEQIEQIRKLSENVEKTEKSRKEFVLKLQEWYDENIDILRPLLIDYHSSSFSIRIRSVLADALKLNAEFPAFPDDPEIETIQDNILHGMIHILLRCLDSRTGSTLQYRIVHSMIESSKEQLIRIAAERNETGLIRRASASS